MFWAQGIEFLGNIQYDNSHFAPYVEDNLFK